MNMSIVFEWRRHETDVDRRQRFGTPLIVVFAAIAALAVTVVVDASKYFLAQRALAAAADATATAAAQSVDQQTLYTSAATTGLPLSDSSVTDAAKEYLDESGLSTKFHELTLEAAAPDSQTAVIHLHAVVHLPFAGIFGGRFAGGVSLDATAQARSPYRP